MLEAERTGGPSAIVSQGLQGAETKRLVLVKVIKCLRNTPGSHSVMRMELFLPSHFPDQNHTLKYIFSAFNCLKYTRESSEMGAVKTNCMKTSKRWIGQKVNENTNINMAL